MDSNSTIFDDDDDDFTSSAANLTSDWPVYDDPFNGTSLEFETDVEDSDVDNEDDADEELREEEYSAEEISIATQIVRFLTCLGFLLNLLQLCLIESLSLTNKLSTRP